MKEKYPQFRIVDETGQVISEDYDLKMLVEKSKSYYYHMLRIRTFDRKGKALQRQGRIGTYVPFEGQEASQVGSALALQTDD